jgi:hypothetical protein
MQNLSVSYRRVIKATATISIAAAALVLAACGSGGTKPVSPGNTIAGVGVALHGRPPLPNTASACVRRWNGRGNASGRAAAFHQAPEANAALVRTAGPTGYFSDSAGRCLVYVTAPHGAVIFVEAARGRFTFVATASGRFPANAKLAPSGRLRLG